MLNSRPTLTKVIVLAVLAALLTAGTLIAPEEATLGAGMRWVYLHVSFTWAGTALINIVGLAGLYLIFQPTAMGYSLWVAPGQAAGLTLFSIGFVLSLVASQTSWGGILWMEPRVQSSIAIIAAGIALVLIVRSVVSPRIIGMLAIAMSIGISIALGLTGRVFHPDDPIGESSSTVIQMTFYALTVGALAFGVVLAMLIKGPPRSALVGND